MARTIALYTGGRVLMFTLVFGLLLLVAPDLNGLLAVALALVASSLLSLVVLRSLRSDLTARLAARHEARLAARQRLRERREAEGL